MDMNRWLLSESPSGAIYFMYPALGDVIAGALRGPSEAMSFGCATAQVDFPPSLENGGIAAPRLNPRSLRYMLLSGLRHLERRDGQK